MLLLGQTLDCAKQQLAPIKANIFTAYRLKHVPHATARRRDTVRSELMRSRPVAELAYIARKYYALLMLEGVPPNKRRPPAELTLTTRGEARSRHRRPLRREVRAGRDLIWHRFLGDILVDKLHIQGSICVPTP